MLNLVNLLWLAMLWVDLALLDEIAELELEFGAPLLG